MICIRIVLELPSIIGVLATKAEIEHPTSEIKIIVRPKSNPRFLPVKPCF
jgi:hypothetical protein